MAGGYQVGIASETKAFKQGVESGIIGPLEDAQKELLDLGRNRGPEQLERGMKDAGDASEKLADETKRTARVIEQEYRDAYRKVERAAQDASDGGTKGMGRLKDGAQEVTQEMGQNLGEAVSSIRGDLTDLGQVGQDTLGGLAATLAGSGPAGIAGAAGLAAGAVGLGLVTAELEKQREQAEALRDRMVDAYRAAGEAGNDYLDIASIIADTQDVINNPDRAEEYQRLLDTQRDTGLQMSTILKANAGDLAALEVVMSSVAKATAADLEARGGEINLFTDGLSTDLQDLQGHWRNTQDAATKASEASSDSIRYTSDLLLEQIAATKDAGIEVDEFGNKLVTLKTKHGETKILVDAETGRATLDVQKFGGDVDDVVDRANGRTVVLKARADTAAAQAAINRVIAQNNGRTIRINSRLVAPMGGDL